MSAFPGLGHQAGVEPISLERHRRNRRQPGGRVSAAGRDAGAAGRDGGRRGPAGDVVAGFGISVSVANGVPVVSFEGRLEPGSVRECATIFAGVVRLRPRRIVADLSRAVIDEDSVPVLGWLRRFAGRHGSRLVLAAVPPRAVDVLRRAEVAPLYEFHASVPLAVDAAMQESHRSFHRG